jgi:hypothetical protein
MKTVPMLEVMVTLNAFSKTKKVFPAHELPIYLESYGAANIEIIGKNGDNHSIKGVDEEVANMVAYHGNQLLQSVFGTNFIDGIEVSINRIIEKEKTLNGSENTAKPKDGSRSETRV